MTPIERAARAVLGELRRRKFLKYLFADDASSRGAYGYVDAPIELDTQDEIATALVRVVLEALREPSEGMQQAGHAILTDPEITREDGSVHIVDGDAEAVWRAMIDAALTADLSD